MNIQKITGESIQGLKKAAKNISDGTPPKMIEDGGEKMAKGMDAIANSGMAHVITRKKEDFESFIKAAEEIFKESLDYTDIEDLKRMGGVPRRIYEIGDGKTREIDFRKEPLLETRLSPALYSPFYNKD